jgi:hypothetical protein
MNGEISWTQLFKNSWQGFSKNHLPGIILWILTISLGPAIGLIMNSKKAIIIGAAIGLTVLVWVCAFFIIKETKTEEIKPKKQEKLTLLSLFKNDFNNLLRGGEDRILTFKTGEKITIKSKIYLDFEAQNEFVGFFIPNTPETFNICVYLAEHYQTALELKNKTMIEMSAPGLQPVNINELKFSGRVFIYHEYPIFEVQKRELYKLYEKHGLSLQFRGAEYLFKKKEIEKAQ